MSLLAGIWFSVMFWIFSKRQEVIKERVCRGLTYPAAFTVKLNISDQLWQIFKSRFNGHEESLISFVTRDLTEYLEKKTDHKIACMRWANISK